MIRCIRRQSMLEKLITNGYLLTPERIRKLNDAGLDHLQISIDNVVPDEVSKKSRKVLDRKLQWLAENAEFEVNINSVLGSSIRHPEYALTIAGRARELAGIPKHRRPIHDGSGQLRKLDHHQRAVFQAMSNLGLTRSLRALRKAHARCPKLPCLPTIHALDRASQPPLVCQKLKFKAAVKFNSSRTCGLVS
jgi:hypothetical protein